MKKVLAIIFIAALALAAFLFFRNKNKAANNVIENTENHQPETIASNSDNNQKQSLRDKIISEFQNASPKEWSEHATGVKTRLDTSDKVIALTFDACGGAGKNGYDEKLIQYLEKEKIPATLFIGGQWIENNAEAFKQLAQNPLFEIENHGYKHIPCSMSGKSAYGIAGENNPGEVVDEIEPNAQRIKNLTGRQPLFYRAGTAFTDEICPQIARELGYQAVSFNVLGDAGATYSADQIKKALMEARPGSIALLHMNHPEKDTAEGIMKAVPALQKMGLKFVKLEDYSLQYKIKEKLESCT